MSITITGGNAATTPLDCLTAEQRRPARTLVHEPIGRADAPDYTLRPAGLRTGTLELFYAVEADAYAAEAMHRAPAAFTYTDTVTPAKNMRYVVADGDLAVRREVPYARWIVSVPFKEVPA